jgi:subtilase family serine protease
LNEWPTAFASEPKSLRANFLVHTATRGASLLSFQVKTLPRSSVVAAAWKYPGETLYCTASAIALDNVVKGVVRLHSNPSSPTAVPGTKIHFTKSGGQFTFDVGSQGLAPADFAKIYNVQPLYNAGINGTGQSIAIVGRSNIRFRTYAISATFLGFP